MFGGELLGFPGGKGLGDFGQGLIIVGKDGEIDFCSELEEGGGLEFGEGEAEAGFGSGDILLEFDSRHVEGQGELCLLGGEIAFIGLEGGGGALQFGEEEIVLLFMLEGCGDLEEEAVSQVEEMALLFVKIFGRNRR